MWCLVLTTPSFGYRNETDFSRSCLSLVVKTPELCYHRALKNKELVLFFRLWALLDQLWFYGLILL